MVKQKSEFNRSVLCSAFNEENSPGIMITGSAQEKMTWSTLLHVISDIYVCMILLYLVFNSN